MNNNPCSNAAFKIFEAQMFMQHGVTYTQVEKAMWRNGYIQGSIDRAKQEVNELHKPVIVETIEDNLSVDWPEMIDTRHQV